MDLWKRLFRRPVTTLLWLFLVMVMAAFLSAGGALWYSSENLSTLLDDYHTAIALRTDRGTTGTSVEGGAIWVMEDMSLTQEDVAWLESLDSVKGVRFHTLTGGYSPAVSPLLGLSRGIGGWADAYPMANDSYVDMLVVGTVQRILKVGAYGTYDMTAIGLSEEEPHYTIYAEVKVERQILGHADLPFYGDSGYDEYLNVRFLVYGQEALEFVEEGQRYLLYGQYDPRSIGEGDLPVQSIHPSLTVGMLAAMGDGILQDYHHMGNGDVKPLPAAAKLEGEAEDFLRDNEQWDAVMELWDTAQHSVPILGTESLESMYVFTKNEATLVDGRMFTDEDYEAGSKVCILSESLAIKAGLKVGDTIPISQFLCDDTMSNSSIESNPDGMLNNPAVGKLYQQPEFVTQNETFTIIGLYRLSDEWEDTSYSITPNTVFIPQKAQIAGGFGGVTREVQQEETFADGTTQTTTYIDDRGAYGVYLSVELRNGHMEDFLLEISKSHLAGQFHTLDQGYEKAQESINAVAASATKLLLAAVTGWVLLLVLYVLLYQGMQRKNLGIMRSLGAAPKHARGYLFGSGMTLAAVGVAIGTALSGVVLKRIRDALAGLTVTQGAMSDHSGGIALSQEALTDMLAQSQFSVPMLILLAMLQLAIIALALWLQAALLARRSPRKLLGA